MDKILIIVWSCLESRGLECSAQGYRIQSAVDGQPLALSTALKPDEIV